MVRIWTTSEGNVRLLSSEQILGRSLGNGKGQIAIRQNGKRLIVGEDEIWTQELGKNEWQRKKKKGSTAESVGS
jgi:hypothetical protein